ncbi:hypothetical protein [bacterium endosymbiont of Bathymodiolus sp. 5 South]|uniref:hypothetical protein n=1 Tax=bacterium endosymbiont of Bathymodiolus sp. 5 South TaxID=1181670 RepID=UPI0010B38010|nr:hypothetical protein [bacterium endosymbiont of Bathymodiolus sp. 5 South]CAC9462613.1 Low molecular weight protein tyrosine phosphatase (EC 3.1.3.48) [uncultured Gammaproteobacteria bacterium]CAC9639934.1 Low molecular weight protein tyrosine phosphatase (EC 3.1.3.48) [uncultured Gammaproteobacteria bacterium]CAC9646454.1 Low molecular weight protein tyrosine phosphatase (EC 3.1.3.48) [uncultured Gammaproteobacteria bacterium]CAC9655670.1 Low molecular weight protein tyrosine phosphatase (E
MGKNWILLIIPIYAKVSQDVLLYLNHNEVLTIQRFSQQYNEWMNAVCFLVFVGCFFKA